MIRQSEQPTLDPLRVCFVGDLIPPLGGSGVYCTEVVSRLDKLNAQVVFVDLNRDMPGKQIPLGIQRYTRGHGAGRVLQIGKTFGLFLHYGWTMWKKHRRLLHSARNVIRTAEMAALVHYACRKAKRVNLIHVCHAMERGLASIIVGEALRLPVVISVMSSEFNEANANVPLATFCCSRADFVIGISNFCTSLARRAASSTPARTIYCGVDHESYHPRANTAGIREKYGVAGPDKLILFAGSFVYRKGPDILVDAMAFLRDTGRLAGRKCLMCGFNVNMQDEVADKVRRCGLEQYVQIVGETPLDDLRKLYAAADLFVFPTRMETEGFGLVAAEAMSSGTPVVASRIAAIPEVVEDGVTGFLVTPGDAGDLAEKITFLLDNDELRKQMGIAGAHRMREKFSWDRAAKETADLYRQLVAAGEDGKTGNQKDI